jgi:hypothetical protein
VFCSGLVCIVLLLYERVETIVWVTATMIQLEILKKNILILRSPKLGHTISDQFETYWWNSMDLFPNEQNFDLDKSIQKFYHSLKEHHKISNIPKFRCEMLYNADNIALRSLPFFSHFVLRTGNWYHFSESGVIQNDWKTANFAGLYYPHFTTFRNETSEYY